ncbi:MAG: type II toxin-antitoxin system Phd/YefM family antitoxin [Thermoanaerobaculia bacterium]
MRSIRASEFKAKCLAILDEVERTGETVTILKRGRAVARLLPPVPAEGRYPQHALFGTVRVVGDIVDPVLPAEDWNAVRGEL